jgi:hypothetical protein
MLSGGSRGRRFNPADPTQVKAWLRVVGTGFDCNGSACALPFAARTKRSGVSAVQGG